MSLSAIKGTQCNNRVTPMLELARKLCKPTISTPEFRPTKTPRSLTKGALEEVQMLIEERDRKVRATDALLNDHVYRASAAETAAKTCWDQASQREASQHARIQRLMVKCLQREIQGIEEFYESKIQSLERSHERELQDAMARRLQSKKQKDVPEEVQLTDSETSNDRLVQITEQTVPSQDHKATSLDSDMELRCDTTDDLDLEEFAITLMSARNGTKDVNYDCTEAQSDSSSSNSSASSSTEQSPLRRTGTMKFFASKSQQVSNLDESQCAAINAVARGLLFQQECRDVDAEFTTLSSDFGIVSAEARVDSPSRLPASIPHPPKIPPLAKPFKPSAYPPTPREALLASMSKACPQTQFPGGTQNVPQKTQEEKLPSGPTNVDARRFVEVEVESMSKHADRQSYLKGTNELQARPIPIVPRLVNVEVVESMDSSLVSARGDLPSARDEGYEVRRFVSPRLSARGAKPLLSARGAKPLYVWPFGEVDAEIPHERRPASVTVFGGHPTADLEDYYMDEVVEPTEILLHVYNMTETSGGVFSGFLNSLGMGMFHVGVQVYGKEWTFNPRGPVGCNYGCGVVEQEPGMHPTYSHHECVSLGCTTLSKEETQALLGQLQKQWSIESHHHLRRNSVIFAEELCKALGVRPPPSYVSALQNGLRSLMFT